MVSELFIHGVGLVTIGGERTREELDEALRSFAEMDEDERRRYFVPFFHEDPETGASVRGLQCIAAPLDAIDVATLMATAVRVFTSDVALRAKWMRQHSGVIALPGTDTRVGHCPSCDSELPPRDVFGYCAACKRAALQVVFTDDDAAIVLPHGIN